MHYHRVRISCFQVLAFVLCIATNSIHHALDLHPRRVIGQLRKQLLGQLYSDDRSKDARLLEHRPQA